MKVLIAGVVLLALTGAVHVLAAWRFRKVARGLVAEITSTRGATPRDDLPPAVAQFAQRGLTGRAPHPGRAHLLQSCEMELKPGAGWQPMHARQAIGLGESGFVWEAWQRKGPLTTLRVIDAYTAGAGRLMARLMGSIPVANASGPVYDRGEAMRYLAELPWAPDAILLNRAIVWHVLDSGEIEARLPLEPRDAAVRFTLDANGDFATIRAEDRPTGEADGVMQYADWEGHFTDYAPLGPRRIPRRAEVGYVSDGRYAPYWRGRIMRYELIQSGD